MIYVPGRQRKTEYDISDLKLPFLLYWGFSAGPDSKESACNEGDPGLIPGSGRSPGEGNGNPLQYSHLENSMDRGAMRSHRVRHDWTTNIFTFLSLSLWWKPSLSHWATREVPHKTLRIHGTHLGNNGCRPRPCYITALRSLRVEFLQIWKLTSGMLKHF